MSLLESFELGVGNDGRRLPPGGIMNEIDFEIAVGEAAQDAVWTTQHPLTLHIAEDDPRREKYLREYQQLVGRQVLAAVRALGRPLAS
jgi:hypothetical protein